VLVVDIVLIIYFGAANPEFFTVSNIQNISNFFSAAALIAAGGGIPLLFAGRGPAEKPEK